MNAQARIHEFVLSEGVAKQRIVAARVLRGIDKQEDLDPLGHDYGLGIQELSRTERGELPLTEVRADAFAKILRFPREWFLEVDLDRLIKWPAEGLHDDQVRRAAELLSTKLLEAARQLGVSSPPAQDEPGPSEGSSPDGP